MNKPQDYSFTIEDYDDYDDSIFIFWHDDPGNAETWDDLEDIIHSDIERFNLIRLDETSFEPQTKEVSEIKKVLLEFGFREK